MGVSLEMLTGQDWIDRSYWNLCGRDRDGLEQMLLAMQMENYVWVRFSVDALSPDQDYRVKRCQLREWCQRNCKGDHFVYDNFSVAFEDNADAVMFFLTWSS